MQSTCKVIKKSAKIKEKKSKFYYEFRFFTDMTSNLNTKILQCFIREFKEIREFSEFSVKNKNTSLNSLYSLNSLNM